MHIKFPQKMERALTAFKHKFLPRSLFFRTMLLIFIPLIVVQVVSIYAFFEGSWGRVGHRLSDNLVSNMAFVMQMHDESSDFAHVQQMAETLYDMQVQYYDNENKHSVWRESKKKRSFATYFLVEALKNKFPLANTAIFDHKGDLNVLVDTDQGLYEFTTPRKNIFTTSVFGFVIWMIGTSLLLFVVAVLFLRVQVRSIAQLATAAEDFGKGINTKFKPYGSIEVRRAGLAFTKMKERIVRNGLLISEYFPGTQPIGAHFPVRNRILAGISEATLVLEAGQRSGSLITARLACEQGKSVLCVPPADLFDPRYSGVAGYLRDGAYPVFNHLDVLYVFYMKYPHTLLNYDDTDASRTLDSLVFAEEPVQKRPKKAKASEKKEAPAEPEPYTIPAEANDAQRRVLEFLKDGGQTINAICMMLGMDFAETSVLMMDLDLAGWVVNTERDTYTLPDGK